MKYFDSGYEMRGGRQVLREPLRRFRAQRAITNMFKKVSNGEMVPSPLEPPVPSSGINRFDGMIKVYRRLDWLKNEWYDVPFGKNTSQWDQVYYRKPHPHEAFMDYSYPEMVIGKPAVKFKNQVTTTTGRAVRNETAKKDASMLEYFPSLKAQKRNYAVNTPPVAKKPKSDADWASEISVKLHTDQPLDELDMAFLGSDGPGIKRKHAPTTVQSKLSDITDDDMLMHLVEYENNVLNKQNSAINNIQTTNSYSGIFLPYGQLSAKTKAILLLDWLS